MKNVNYESDLVALKDRTYQVQEVEKGKRFETMVQIVGTGKEYDNIDSPIHLASFSHEDVQRVSYKIEPEAMNSLCGNGFDTYIYAHAHGKSLYSRRIIMKENKYLSDRGWRGIYGDVVVCAQFEKAETGEPVDIPSSTALEMAKIILESKGKSLDSIYTNAGSRLARNAEMNAWFFKRVREIGFEAAREEYTKQANIDAWFDKRANKVGFYTAREEVQKRVNEIGFEAAREEYTKKANKSAKKAARNAKKAREAKEAIEEKASNKEETYVDCRLPSAVLPTHYTSSTSSDSGSDSPVLNKKVKRRNTVVNEPVVVEKSKNQKKREMKKASKKNKK